MKKHLKFVLFLGAIALIATLILNLKKEQTYDKVPAVEKLAAREFLGVKVLDIFLGVLGLAFLGIAVGYVASLVKGGAKKEEADTTLASAEAMPAGEAAIPAAEELPRKRLALEKVLGRIGAKILSVLLVTLLVLIVVAIVLLLFSDKLPFARKLLEALSPGKIV